MVNDLCDGEGPNEPGGYLTTRRSKGQITGGEPDTLAESVGGRGLSMLVGTGSIVVGRFEEGRARAQASLGRGRARERVNSTVVRPV